MPRYVVRFQEGNNVIREVTVDAEKGVTWDNERWVAKLLGDHGPVAYFSIGNLISIIEEGVSPT